MKNVLKRSLSLLLAITIIMGSAYVGLSEVDFSGLFAVEAKAATSGTCGDNLTWLFDDKGTLTISGTGAIKNYSTSSSVPWYSMRSEITTIIINSGVTSIGDDAFYYCNNLTSITVPDSITSIGGYAFCGCTKLKSITIPKGVTIIDEFAFNGCKTFTSITIPDSITSIGRSAFAGCINLTSIIIPDAVSNIGKDAFDNTGYYNDNSNWVNGVLYINNHLIEAEDSISGSYVITEGTKMIADYAFFSRKTLTSITIPDSITNIGENVFSSCTSLTSINVDENNLNYSSSEGVLFNKNKTTLLKYPEGKTDTEYSIPESVTSIGDSAFKACIGVTSVAIPDKVTSIGDSAFFGCTNLSIISLSNNLTSIGGLAFMRCSSLSSIIIPDSVTNLGGLSFAGCTNLSSIVLSRSLKIIYACTFDSCTSLISITIPSGIEAIDKDCFGDCTNLQTIIIPDSVTSIADNSFNNCPQLSIVGNTGSYAESYAEMYGFDFTSFNSGNSGNSYNYYDSYFNNSATSYNHELATTSCYLALSTFQSAEQGITHTDAVSLLKGCGFDSESIKLYNYYSNTNPDNIGCIIAQKKIGDETLIAIAVRGGDYGKEWASNFTIGTSGDHQGFDEASDIVLSRIKGYIENQSISGKVKFWLTGFSRAAATATQTAAKLNFTYIENVEFTKNDVYAYGFATPAGAITDSDPTNLSKYGNIFHIINFHDVVPRVAPKLWGFGRYGKTYYLPFSENSSGTAVDKEQDVIEWFEYNGLDYKVDEFVATYSDSAFSYIPKSNDTLGVFCEKLVNDIAILINSRSSYVEKLQNSIRETVIEENLSVSNKTVEKLLDVLVAGVLLKPQYISTILSSPLMLIEAHAAYGAYYLGWMEVIPADRALDYLNNGDTRHWLFNCPVDVYVYDKSGTLVAAIENDTPVEIEDAPFSYGVDENGQKYFYLPVDGEYDVKVIAREDCETTCTVNELSGGLFDESRVVTYTEIPMVKDEELSVSTGAYSEDDIVNGTEEGSSAEYIIQKETGEVLEPNVDVAGEEIEDYTYNVTVEYDENKGIVYGGGEFTIGQFCQVTAENKPGYKFSKWTVNGETVSTEPTYRFAVKEDVTIVAEYEVCEHPTWTTEAVAVTCTEDGYTKHTCDVCTYSYNDNIVESTGHNYQWCETVTPTTSQSGLKQYICLVCENVGRSEMLPILSGFNFVATDVSSYSLASYNGTATEVKIPANHNNCVVTSVGSSCFKGNENITRVEIPVGITTIGYLAFYGCTALDTVSIPATVTSIGAQAFHGFKGTIICQKDSYAHQYAIENGIDFIIPTLKATDSKSFIDFENQFVFSTITKCKNIDDIIVGPPTMLTLPTASLKSNGGDFYGTGSTITMFDGNTFMGDYVLIINGDINGDSACDALDAAQVALVSNGQKTIDGAYAMAADNNHDDEISIEDYQAIVNKVIA